ncbi:hypothetical protein [Aquabacterium sp.]|uniref:hypothetical protein n=1 Tax=Aquabacterium sp. TaxID=1872578 RepID=UPI0035AFEC24
MNSANSPTKVTAPTNDHWFHKRLSHVAENGLVTRTKFRLRTPQTRAATVNHANMVLRGERAHSKMPYSPTLNTTTEVTNVPVFCQKWRSPQYVCRVAASPTYTTPRPLRYCRYPMTSTWSSLS